VKLRPLALLEPPLPGLDEGDAAKLRWVVGLRWVALGAQALSILPGLHFELLEWRLLPPFAAIVCGLALVNVATRARLARGAEVTQREILAQLSLDVLALGSLLALTGGAWNPLVPLIFFHAGLGAILLEGPTGVAFLWILIASLFGVQLLSHIPPGLADARLEPLVLFPAQLLVATSFWLLSRWLSRMLNSMQRHFAALRERQGRIDRLAAIGALAAGLSHELATPLNTAMLALERVGRKHRLEEAPEVRDASEALDRCEDVLRHMAGAQLRPEGLELEHVDLIDLAATVCSSAEASGGGGKVRFFSTGRAPAEVLLPAIPFTQALLNLIENAQEASAPGADVEIALRAERDWVTLEVRDRGEGWPEVVRAHLGEPFVTTRVGGVGLGLYYVWTLMSALGGELTLEDRPGGGATAKLRLPTGAATQEGVA
jgi:two-component system sensor histidine kinase RegB